ncbi:hypothetical protein FRC10_008703, partial [Ceratobasidium sp. 414]
MAGFDGFDVDISSDGILPVKISLKVRAPGDEPPNNLRKWKRKADWEDPKHIETTVPLWLPIQVSDGGEEKIIPGTQYVSCRYQASIEMFITKDDFIARMPKDDGAHWAIYVKDWEAASAQGPTPDSLSCDGYDDHGAKIGTPGARAWPSHGFIQKDSSKESDSAEVKARNLAERYRSRAQIWTDVAVKYMSAGASRLWKPTLWTWSKPIKLYFLPVGTWPTRKDLSAIVEKIKADAKEKEGKGATRRLTLTKWLDWEAPIEDSKIPNDLVKISRNLLNHYETYISKADLKILLQEQTQGKPDWQRPWPTQAEAESFQNEMLENAKPNYKALLKALREEVTSPIYSMKAPDERIRAASIMGNQSANLIGLKWWMPPENGPEIIAEVFGTFEANSDMTRSAELLVRILRNISGAKGNLTTRVVNSDPQKIGDPQLMYLNPRDSKEEPWKIDKWIREKNYPWIAPGLLYTGNMTLPGHELPVVWSTRFHTFSRYSPTLVEGRVDVALRDEYLKTHPGTSASGPKKIGKVGPSTPFSYTGASYSAVYTMATMTSPSSAPMADPNIESSSAGRPVDPLKPATVAPHPRTHTAWQAIRVETNGFN